MATINVTTGTGSATVTISTGARGPAGQGVPTGGSTGQVLKKTSGTDYDTEWAAEAGGSVSDAAYDATSWNGVTTVAPSKNAVRDKIETLAAASHTHAATDITGTAVTLSGNQTLTGTKTVPGLTFANGDEIVPSTLLPAVGTTGALMENIYLPSTPGTLAITDQSDGLINLTNFVTGTLSVANGGTGATDASTARTNLGATTIGGGIFTAADAAAVNTLLGIQSKTGTSTGLSAVGTTDITGLTGYTLDASTWYKLELHYLWTSTSSNFQINFVTTGTFERGATTGALGQSQSANTVISSTFFVGDNSFALRGNVGETRTNHPQFGYAYFKTGTSGTGKVQLQLLAGTTLSTITSSKAVLTKM